MSSSEPESPNARILLTAATPGVGFTVVDGTFKTVGRAVGRLEVEVPEGIYEIQIRAGSSVETQLVSLQPGETWKRLDVAPGLYAAAPLAGSRTASPKHTEAVERASRAVAAAPGPAVAGLVVVVRRTVGEATLHHRQLELLDASLDPVPDWPADWVVDEDHGVATIGARLGPGPYVLRLTPDEGPALDQTVWVSADWQTLVFCPNGTDRAELDDAVVHLTPLGQPFPGPHPEIAAAVEIATSGLRQGLPLVNDDLLQVLRDSDFADPMLGITGAHAMLLRDQPDYRAFAQVVAELQARLPDHPDVLALARHPSCSGRDLRSVWWPPMLAASYNNLLLPADQRDDTAIQDRSPAERVAGFVVQRGPWLCWTATPEVLSPAAETAELTAVTEGAKDRLEKHLREVRELTGDDQHKVAGSLGAPELARRLQLPVQTVRAVLKGLGWDTVLLDEPRTVIDDATEEELRPIPSGTSPFAVPDPAPVTFAAPATSTVTGTAAVARVETRGTPKPRIRSWMLVLAGVVVAVALVVAGARYFGNGPSGDVELELENQPDFFDRTAVRTQDLTVALRNNADPQQVEARIDGAGYAADATACSSVRADDTCLVRITFAPPAQQNQPMLATLVLTTPGAPELQVPLYGTSRAPEGVISVEWVDVPEVVAGQTIRPTVLLDNIPPDAVHTVVTVTLPPGFEIGRFDAKDKCDARRGTVIYCWVGLDSFHDDWRIRVPLIAQSGAGGTLKVDAQLSRNPALRDPNPEDNTAETSLTVN